MNLLRKNSKNLLILAIFLMYALPAVVIDRKGIIESIEFSFKIAWGSWWYSFFSLIIPLIVSASILILCSFSEWKAIVSKQPYAASWTMVAIQVVAATLIAPWLYSVVVVLYKNVKLRKGIAD